MADLFRNPAALHAALEAIAAGMLLGMAVRGLLSFIHADTTHDDVR